MNTRVEIKTQARDNFMAQYWISIAAFVLYFLIVGLLSAVSAGLAALFLGPPVIVAYSFFSLQIYNGKRGDLVPAIEAGFSDYTKKLGGILWMYLFTFLWTLLFIVPGIIKGIAYSMTPYLLLEMKNISATEAIKISMKMTAGHKGAIFTMHLSFIGWWILSILTLGLLAYFYVGPYMLTSMAGHYCELKQIAIEKGILDAENFDNSTEK